MITVYLKVSVRRADHLIIFCHFLDISYDFLLLLFHLHSFTIQVSHCLIKRSLIAAKHFFGGQSFSKKPLHFYLFSITKLTVIARYWCSTYFRLSRKFTDAKERNPTFNQLNLFPVPCSVMTTTIGATQRESTWQLNRSVKTIDSHFQILYIDS